MNDSDFKYWAFISYSHADEEWAKWLHKSIETYRVPRKIVGRETAQGPISKRLFPVFRDREELPGASDLGGKLQDALTKSRSLIVICSPKSAVSKWVNEEVKTYKSFGHTGRVFCLITDGEPNAAPDSGLLECFPPAVRFRVTPDGQVTTEPAEPIAADARPGKDGKTNALLKLLSGVMGVGYDELRRRERQRQRQRRMRFAALGVLALFLMAIGYVAVADAGLNLPASARIRRALDRNEASVLRPTRSNAEIRQGASTMRYELAQALKRGQTAKGGIPSSLNPAAKPSFEYWSNGQALTAVFATPELSDADARQVLKGFEEHFEAGSTIEGRDGRKYGWIAHPREKRTQAEPAIWTVAALATALGRPGLLTGQDRERALRRLAYAQESLRIYRPLENGGWNMFPNQEEPALNNVYTTTLALLALLETRKANLPWEGSVEKRDQLLKATAQWLADEYDDKASPAGWHAKSETHTAAIDGLTLQIYGELLRAEAEAGFVLPARIANQIPEYLAKCVERDLNFPSDSGEFAAIFTDHLGQTYMAREALGFLWYPWAMNSAQLWLLRAEKLGAPKEDQVRVRRALGHLVNGLGNDAVSKYKSEWTFQAAETLYGLSAIPPQ
ncbi:MAG TPA: toll/interleukin-1 receptor domain-containing protein [Pyrinomonadaceae bacterium]|nr:toll/interleukin-1 receptor domain-containing protein [Pyrinomonadaceae bacterium]